MVGAAAMPIDASSVDGDAAERRRAGQRAVQAGGDLADGAAVGDVGQQDGELVAAEAGEDVVAAQRLAQARGDVDEQLVAVLVAQRVVDLLEAVEVDEQSAASEPSRAALASAWRRARGAPRGWTAR